MVSADPEKPRLLTVEAHEQLTKVGRFSRRKDAHSRNLFWPRLAVSADTTVRLPVRVVGVTDTSSARTITLASNLVKNGRVITIKDESGGAASQNITIATEGSETIDGSATYVMDSNNESVTLYSDDDDWFIAGAYLE